MINVRCEEKLVHAIISQAVKDYKELMKKGLSKRTTKFGGSYSLHEIERFFKSKWCEYMLTMIDCDIRGVDI